MKSVYYHLLFIGDNFLAGSGDFLKKQDITCWVVAGAQTKVSSVLKQCRRLCLVGACCLRYWWHVKSNPGSPVWVTDLWLWRSLVCQKNTAGRFIKPTGFYNSCHNGIHHEYVISLCQMTLRDIKSWGWFNFFCKTILNVLAPPLYPPNWKVYFPTQGGCQTLRARLFTAALRCFW